MRFTRTIYFRFIVVFVLFFLFMSSIILYAYNINNKEMKKKNINLINEQMYYSLNYLSDDLSRIEEKTISFNYDSDIKNIMLSYDYLSYNELSTHINSLAGKIDTMYTTSRFIKNIDFYLPIVKKVISKTKNHLLIKDLDDLSYAKIKDTYRVAENKLYLDNNNNFFFLDTNSFFIGQSDMNEYLFCIEFDKSALDDLFSTFVAYEGSNVYMIDNSGKILYTSPGSETVDYDTLYKSSNMIEVSGKKYIVLREDSVKSQLFLIMTINERNFNKYSNNISIIYAVLFFMLMLLVVLSAIYFSRLVQKPIKLITDATRNIEKGDFNIRIDYKKNNEFKILCNRFNRMSQRLSSLVNEVYQKNILINQAQLKQLQSQINPHFLYNSFFILSRMIKSNDNKNGYRFVNHLASYFEHITRSDKDVCMLSKEISHMNDYIAIQKVRYGDKLIINQQDRLEEKDKDIIVPRLILQPIIENYFKYSRLNDADKIIFEITFRKENDFICIEFSDNVGTIDQRTLSELKNELHSEKINQNYTGLININKRLKIAFGNESGVFIDNIPGGGVRTIIRIYASHGRKTG
ncbi:MAG: histidine kinase [Clostridiaceae bacterium]|jgi:two-component system sensor histidine kinase YesM|nr:histidine kinase [Clostridiaceae bacterium]